MRTAAINDIEIQSIPRQQDAQLSRSRKYAASVETLLCRIEMSIARRHLHELDTSAAELLLEQVVQMLANQRAQLVTLEAFSSAAARTTAASSVLNRYGDMCPANQATAAFPYAECQGDQISAG